MRVGVFGSVLMSGTPRYGTRAASRQRFEAFGSCSDCDPRANPCLSRNATNQRQGVLKQAGRNLWALDFDGVLCDSVGESSRTAIRAASDLWPDIFDEGTVSTKMEEIIEGMREVRPVVETGYENIVQARALLEGVQPADILDNWHHMLKEKMQQWSLDRQELVQLFGCTRDAWMAEDIEEWLRLNRIYEGVAEPLRAAMLDADSEVFIVTTKQARFAKEILQMLAGIEIPMDRMFSTTESGQPKWQVLEKLCQANPGLQLHFVEDKLSALQLVMEQKSLRDAELYLVDWGYTTKSELQWAQDSERISVIDVECFGSLLGN